MKFQKLWTLISQNCHYGTWVLLPLVLAYIQFYDICAFGHMFLLSALSWCSYHTLDMQLTLLIFSFTIHVHYGFGHIPLLSALTSFSFHTLLTLLIFSFTTHVHMVLVTSLCFLFCTHSLTTRWTYKLLLQFSINTYKCKMNDDWWGCLSITLRLNCLFGNVCLKSKNIKEKYLCTFKKIC